MSSLSPAPVPHDELMASLTRINSHDPPVHTCSTRWIYQGFYSGPTSIAYLFYKLSQFYPGMVFKSQYLLDWAEEYLSIACNYPDTFGVRGDNCGITNEALARLTLCAVISKDVKLVEQLCKYSAMINDCDSTRDDWIKGRAGYLYFLRLARMAFRNTTSTCGMIDHAIGTTASSLVVNATNPPTHDIAPGIMAVITQVTLSSPAHFDKVKPLLLQIIPESKTEDQGFGSTITYSEIVPMTNHHLMSPCQIASLESISLHVPDVREELKAIIDDAKTSLWQQRSGINCALGTFNLLHGIPAMALAMNGHQKHRQDFLEIMKEAFSSDEDLEKEYAKGGPGLWDGEAGRAWMWAVAELEEEGAGYMGFIGYNDL